MLRILSFLCSHTHTVVIVQILNGDFRILFGDILKPGLGCALWHPDYTLLSQLVGCPCDPASMVTVRRRKEGRLAEFFLKLCGSKHIVRNLADVLMELLCHISGDGIRSAQNLERIQPEAVRLIFHIQPPKSQIPGKLRQPGQRRRLVLRKALMEITSLFHLIHRHILNLRVVTFSNVIKCPFQFCTTHVSKASYFLIACF